MLPDQNRFGLPNGIISLFFLKTTSDPIESKQKKTHWNYPSVGGGGDGIKPIKGIRFKLHPKRDVKKKSKEETLISISIFSIFFSFFHFSSYVFAANKIINRTILRNDDNVIEKWKTINWSTKNWIYLFIFFTKNQISKKFRRQSETIFLWNNVKLSMIFGQDMCNSNCSSLYLTRFSFRWQESQKNRSDPSILRSYNYFY